MTINRFFLHFFVQIHIQLQEVQEELQHLSQQLEPEDQEEGDPLSEREEEEEEDFSEASTSLLATRGSPTHVHLRSRMKSLQTEFVDLMGELRRRSSIIDGLPVSFEVSY